jgi:hypothetical protein
MEVRELIEPNTHIHPVNEEMYAVDPALVIPIENPFINQIIDNKRNQSAANADYWELRGSSLQELDQLFGVLRETSDPSARAQIKSAISRIQTTLTEADLQYNEHAKQVVETNSFLKSTPLDLRSLYSIIYYVKRGHMPEVPEDKYSFDEDLEEVS